MSAKVRGDGGSTRSGPSKTVFRLPDQDNDIYAVSHADGPYARCSFLWPSPGPVNSYTLQAPFVRTDSNTNIVALGDTSGVSRAYFRVPAAGLITQIGFSGEDGITQSGTNFHTFTGLNLKTAGTGTVAVLSTTANVNTTNTNAAALNGGTDLTAKVFYPFTLHGTAANLNVKAGDIIEVTATATAAGAIVDAAYAQMTIKGVPAGMTASISHTEAAGALVPLATTEDDTANGPAIIQLTATNEVQNVHLDWADQLLIPATKRPYFEARVKLPTVTTAQALVIGLASAFNATFDSVASNMWFKYAASLAALVETDDGTTDDDDNSTGVTSTTGTYYLFTVDARDLSDIKFYINNDQVLAGTNFSATALTVSSLLQPMIALQKASGTGTISVSVDHILCQWDRF